MNLAILTLRSSAILMKCLSQVKLDNIALKSAWTITHITKKTITHITKKILFESLDYLPRTRRQKKLYGLVQRLVNRELDKLSIPRELRPKVKLVGTTRLAHLNPFVGAYLPETNQIMINFAQCKLDSKLNYFKLRVICRHEAKHAQQYTELARAGYGSELKILNRKLVKKAKKYPIELSKERLLLAKSYLSPFIENNLSNPLALLYTSNVRKINPKYRCFFEFMDKATRREKFNYWSKMATDIKPQGKLDKSIWRYLDLHSKKQSQAWSNYYNHKFEQEARDYQDVLSPDLTESEILHFKKIYSW